MQKLGKSLLLFMTFVFAASFSFFRSFGINICRIHSSGYELVSSNIAIRELSLKAICNPPHFSFKYLVHSLLIWQKTTNILCSDLAGNFFLLENMVIQKIKVAFKKKNFSSAIIPSLYSSYLLTIILLNVCFMLIHMYFCMIIPITKSIFIRSPSVVFF